VAQPGVFRALQTAAGHNRATYWPAQVLFTGLALTPVWVAGLVWGTAQRLCIDGSGPAVIGAALSRSRRSSSWAQGVLLRGRPTRSLLAAGHRCRAAGRWLLCAGVRAGAALGPAGRRPRSATLRGRCPSPSPLLPAVTLHTVPLQTINYDLAETIAWPRDSWRLIGPAEYHALPVAQRDRDHDQLAGNYGRGRGGRTGTARTSASRGL